ncbi:9979_t:CDS:1, partial [Racocetra persica]
VEEFENIASSYLEDRNLENRVQQIETELLVIKCDFENRVQQLV